MTFKHSATTCNDLFKTCWRPCKYFRCLCNGSLQDLFMTLDDSLMTGTTCVMTVDVWQWRLISIIYFHLCCHDFDLPVQNLLGGCDDLLTDVNECVLTFNHVSFCRMTLKDLMTMNMYERLSYFVLITFTTPLICLAARSSARQSTRSSRAGA